MIEISAGIIFGFLITSLVIATTGRIIEEKSGFTKTVEFLSKCNIICYFGVIFGIILLFASLVFF